VDQRAAQYRVRLARPDEMSRIREIEDKAGTVFAGPMAAISAILITCSGSRVVADASKNCTLKGKDHHDHPKPKRPSRCAGW
jgi:hypothetical protein